MDWNCGSVLALRGVRAAAFASMVLGVTVAAPTAATAIGLSFTHPYGEIVDRGVIAAQLSSLVELECPSSVQMVRTGQEVVLTVRRALPGQTATGACRFTATGNLGVLQAGTYRVTARVLLADGVTPYESVTETLDVMPIAGRCNRDPVVSPSVMAKPKGVSAADFVARVKSDPDFAALLGNPAVRVQDYQAFDDEVWFDYPPLDDIPPAMERLARSGVLEWQQRNTRGACGVPPPDQIEDIVEFFNAILDHYFYTGDVGEIAAIEAGRVGVGWVRTGKSFRALTNPGCVFQSAETLVYRFNGIPGVGPDSHFFTRDRSECAAVDRSKNWLFEGVPFWAGEPAADGTCTHLATRPGQKNVPLYRAWRPFGDSNHRFTTERAVVAQMVAKGWVDEGPAMCVLAPG